MTEQLFRVKVVLALTGVVLLATFFAAGLWAVERFLGRPRRPWERALLQLSVPPFLLGVVLLAWGLFIEADWLEVTRHEVTTPKWPTTVRRRIALVSDFHVDRQSRALGELARALRDAKVDVLVFTGDALNAREATGLFRSALGGLPARLGRVAVRGNHDVTRWADVDLFGTGVATELLSDAPHLLDDGRLAFCGAPWGALEGIEACLARAPTDALVVFAYHSPDLVEALAPRPDLYLAGHTHGGQVALPGYGALLTFSRFDKKYEAGRYQVGETTLFVNRGLGFEPGLPRLRLFARPELTLIDVVGTGRQGAERGGVQ